MESNNAAALREALDCALVVLDGFGYGRPDCVRAAYDCKTALAAPPRNCDRFANEAEARKAFIVWYNTVYELWGDKWNEVSICDLKHNVDDILQDYIKWLFSPVEDMKGEANGSK